MKDAYATYDDLMTFCDDLFGKSHRTNQVSKGQKVWQWTGYEKGCEASLIYEDANLFVAVHVCQMEMKHPVYYPRPDSVPELHRKISIAYTYDYPVRNFRHYDHNVDDAPFAVEDAKVTLKKIHDARRAAHPDAEDLWWYDNDIYDAPEKNWYQGHAKHERPRVEA